MELYLLRVETNHLCELTGGGGGDEVVQYEARRLGQLGSFLTVHSCTLCLRHPLPLIALEEEIMICKWSHSRL